MNLVQVGKKIKLLRQEANLTQRELASLLSVTDKAVSKWERGIGFPETSVFHKLSKILDVDMDFVLTTNNKSSDDWHGIIIYNGKQSLKTLVYDKPIINYLLQYFLLSRIRKITFQVNLNNRMIIEKLNLEQYGIIVDFDYDMVYTNAMVLYEPVLLFGANLTRYFETCMENENNVALSVDGVDVPIAFIHNCEFVGKLNTYEKCNLTRGVISLPLANATKVKEASSFVRIYQKNHHIEIANLKEIAVSRGLISK